MRIGVITFCNSKDNYGQVLQCWALQRKLILWGHTPFLIRYSYKQNTKERRFQGLKRIIKILLVIPILHKYRHKKKQEYYKKVKNLERKNALRKFKEFKNASIYESEKEYKSIKELRKRPPMANAYIVGSDQVWCKLPNQKENLAYFLDFGERKSLRISYAASFGRSTYPKDVKNILAKQLQRFNALSVREPSGVTICKELGYKATYVLDPTLLLDVEQYSIIENKEKNLGDYIFVYAINITSANDIYWHTIKEYASLKKYKKIATCSSGYIPGFELLDDAEYIYAEIPQWLSLIRDAKVVITTSFHGTVFCILYHKPFACITLKGPFSSGNNRIEDLLYTLGLEDRIFNNDANINSILGKNINWKEVDKKLESLKVKSSEFLEKSLRCK